MEYAIFKASGKQYLAKAGDVLEVNKIEGEKSLYFDEVLLLVTDGKVKLGQPLVKGVRVKATILEQKKRKETSSF